MTTTKMTTNWEILQNKFLNEHSLSGISVKAWCEKNNINYATARRHIKLNAQTEQTDVRKTCGTKKIKNAHKTSITKKNKFKIQSLINNKEDTSMDKEINKTHTPKKRVASLGNQNSRKFGYYSEFIKTDEDIARYTLASTSNLGDELNLTRMQLSNLMDAITMVKKDIKSVLTVEQKVKLHEINEKYQTIASVKVARIESLQNSITRNEKTKIDIEKNAVSTEKVKLEIEKLRAESNGGANDFLKVIYETILNNGNDGMLNNN